MMLMCFIVGVCGITSYTIRVSATQSYVPDGRKGRVAELSACCPPWGPDRGICCGSPDRLLSGKDRSPFLHAPVHPGRTGFYGGGRHFAAPICNRSA